MRYSRTFQEYSIPTAPSQSPGSHSNIDNVQTTSRDKMPPLNTLLKEIPRFVARLRRRRQRRCTPKEATPSTTDEVVSPQYSNTPSFDGILGDFTRNIYGSRFTEDLVPEGPSSSSSTKSHVTFAELPSRRSYFDTGRPSVRPPTPHMSAVVLQDNIPNARWDPMRI